MNSILAPATTSHTPIQAPNFLVDLGGGEFDSETSSGMQQQQQQQGFDTHKLQQEVKVRWLKPKEVLQILENHEQFKITLMVHQKPPSGSLFLFNRRVLRRFRNDGYEWRKKRNGKTIAEAHERLKVDNVEALNCYYAHGDKNPTFQRRTYWMLEPAYEHIVLVHYRDVLKGSIAVPAQNKSPTSNQNISGSRVEAQSSPGWASELIGSCPNSCSAGSAEEVSSQNVTVNNETSNSDPSRWIQNCSQEALWKLDMGLSPENNEDCNVNTKVVPSNSEALFLHGIQNEEPDTSEFLSFDISNHSSPQTLEDIFDELDFSKDGQTKETRIPPVSSAIDVLKNSDTWLEEDQLEAILRSDSMAVTENQWFHIHEVSPEWAFCSECTKVIIVGDFLCNPSNSSWEILFGDVKVPVEYVQQGVIRCHAPCHDAGKVKMCMIDGNGKPCSEVREFEYREKPLVKSTDELLLLLECVQMLFDGDFCGLVSKFNLPLSNLKCRFQADPSKIVKRICNQLDHDNTLDCVLEVLLYNKFAEWLTSKCAQNSGGDCLLPKQYHGVIHIIAALGYDSALKPLLSSGIPINYRDANGWTALHWAARFGREEMVVALIAAGAAAGALSHPTSEDPAAKTPASIASACGYKGLSAYLSEAELITHVYSLASKENENSRDHVCGEEISRAVDRISDKCAHAHGGTDDQLALKDCLAATRNAVQAAGHIQAAFRAFSFRKKQQMALQDRENFILSIHQTGAITCGMREKAALSIQKNFRCWKKRKEFLEMRKEAIKIQARVRAHQERRKFKELLRSVGILEKVMLRWFRKGVGLRGFNAGAMPIDREEEDDIINVFRKKRVETALNEAVSRVSGIIHSPIARQQYRRMLERFNNQKMTMKGSKMGYDSVNWKIVQVTDKRATTP